MTYLSKDDILKADDVEVEDVFVPAWKGTVRVRGLSGAERDRYLASLSRQQGSQVVRNPVNATAKLVALCVVDGDGNRVFGNEHVAALGEKSGAALDPIFEVASRLSGISGEEIKEIEENFGATQSGEPISG